VDFVEYPRGIDEYELATVVMIDALYGKTGGLRLR
jgi:hypothetical protein